MTLDKAIEHAEEVAEEQDKLCKRYDDASGYTRSHNEDIRTSEAKQCERCAEEHRQLAEWLKDYKRLVEIDKIKRYKIGDRIFSRHWKELLTTALILSNKGYGVKVIGLRGLVGNILTITSLPEENDQLPDMRVTAEEAAEAIQNLAKAGMSQEDIESAECEFCGTPGKTIGIVETDDRIFVGISGAYIQIFDESYPGFVENMPIRFCPMCGRRLSLREAPFCHCEAKMQKSEDKK